jgi:hypothetical protein
MESGGYGQLQYKAPGGDWVNATMPDQYGDTSLTTRIDRVGSFQRSSNLKWQSFVEVTTTITSLNYQRAPEQDTEELADSIQYRILPIQGSCLNNCTA